MVFQNIPKAYILKIHSRWSLSRRFQIFLLRFGAFVMKYQDLESLKADSTEIVEMVKKQDGIHDISPPGNIPRDCSQGIKFRCSL